MDKSLERDILSSLGKVVDLVRSGTDQVAALTKVASERGYSVPVISRMCEAYNKSKSVYYLSKTASDKRAEAFDLVDPSDVIGGIFNKTASKREGFEMPDFSKSDLIAFERKAYMQKTAELLWDNADKGLLDESPDILAHREHKARVLREQLVKKANDEGRVLKLQVETLVDDLTERAQRLTGAEFNKVASRIHSRYGGKGDDLIRLLEARLGVEAELEKEAKAVIFDNVEPYLTAAKTMKALGEYHEFLKQAEDAGVLDVKKNDTSNSPAPSPANTGVMGGKRYQGLIFGSGASRDAFNKNPDAFTQSVERGVLVISPKDQAARTLGQSFPFQDPPSDEITMSVKSSGGLEKQGGIDLMDAVALPVLSSAMSPGRDEDITDIVKKPAPSKAESVLSSATLNTLDNLKTQSAFYDMVANDDFLAKQPIDDVMKAYKKIIRIAPSLRDNPDAAANLVARAIETGNRLDPAEISNLYTLEGVRRRSEQGRVSELALRKELGEAGSPYERGETPTSAKHGDVSIAKDVTKALFGGKKVEDKPTPKDVHSILGTLPQETRDAMRNAGIIRNTNAAGGTVTEYVHNPRAFRDFMGTK